jgi:hypothetical protein
MDGFGNRCNGIGGTIGTGRFGSCNGRSNGFLSITRSRTGDNLGDTGYTACVGDEWLLGNGADGTSSAGDISSICGEFNFIRFSETGTIGCCAGNRLPLPEGSIVLITVIPAVRTPASGRTIWTRFPDMTAAIR